MMQLGNLAVVCAKRSDVLMQIQGKIVSVYLGEGPDREAIRMSWDDDKKISDVVRELNFGKYSINKRGGMK